MLKSMHSSSIWAEKNIQPLFLQNPKNPAQKKKKISRLQFNQYYHTINTSNEILLISSSASFPFCFLNPVLYTCITFCEQRQQFPDVAHYALYLCEQYLLGFLTGEAMKEKL